MNGPKHDDDAGELPSAPGRQSAPPGQGWRIGLGVVPLVPLVVVAFLPILDNGFVNWDDELNLRDNVHFRGLGLAPLKWAWTTLWLGVYQPLAWMLFDAQFLVWRLDPYGFHLTSLVLHAANMVVLYVLTVSLLLRSRAGPGVESAWPCALASATATAVFAVHPLRVEVVAWASCQPYLPCALCSMLAVLAYLRAVDADDGRRRNWLLVAFGLFVAALLFHAIAVSLPAVLLILDVCPLRRIGDGAGRWSGPVARTVYREKVPFVLASLAFAGLAVAARHRDVFSTDQLATSARIAQACYGAWFYIVKTAWPTDLFAVYPLPRPIHWRAPLFPFRIIAALGLSAGLFLLRRRWPGLLAAWLSYLVVLAPNSGLIRTSEQIAADRYSYLATMGWVVVLAAGLSRVGRGPGRAAGTVAIGLAVLSGLVVLTRGQCRTWHDSRTLWTHALTHRGGSSWAAHYNLGHELLSRGNPRAAAAQYAAALRIDPTNVSGHNNLGVALSRLGRYDEAAAQHAEALRLDPGSADAHYNLGVILARQRKYAEAAAHYRASLRLDPDAAEVHYNLAMILASQGNDAEAEAHYTEALRITPGLAPAHNNLGVILSRQGRHAAAAMHFAEALRLDPKNSEARDNLEHERARQQTLDQPPTH